MGKVLSFLLLGLIAFLFIPTGLVLASQTAVPGDAAYPVKRSLERVIISLAALHPKTSAFFHADLMNRRFKEAVALLKRGGDASEVLVELVAQTNTAVGMVETLKDESQKQEYINQLSKNLEEYDKALDQLAAPSPNQTAPQPTTAASTPTATLPPTSSPVPTSTPRQSALPSSPATPAPTAASSPSSMPVVPVTPTPSLAPFPTPLPSATPTPPVPDNPDRLREIEEARRKLEEARERLGAHSSKRDDKQDGEKKGRTSDGEDRTRQEDGNENRRDNTGPNRPLKRKP